MRRPIIIGNWKMNMKLNDGIEFLKQLENVEVDKQVGIACQFVSLEKMKSNAHNILIGAQNVHEELSGAYTGEVSIELLSELKLDFCLVGHSERRQYFGETDVKVNQKAKLLLANNIMPVICVGETLDQFENSLTKQVIEKQISITCENLDIEKCVIAYEPVWAIGTGKTATSQIAQEVCHLIREKITSMYSKEIADKVRIQYGGSVNENNIEELLACKDIDGALVGGVSLKIKEFIKLISA